MIHYVTTTASGGYIVLALQDHPDIGVILARGADRTRGVPCTGHNTHPAGTCRCAVSWTEPEGTEWEQRGFRWYVKKRER